MVAVILEDALGIIEGRDDAAKMNLGEYRRIALAYQTVAEELGIPAHVLQAVVWVRWKNLVG